MNESPAYHLIRHVYENEGHRMGRSRERVHHAINSSVQLAIRFGLQFHVDDFVRLSEEFYTAEERDYAIACGIERGHHNITAAQAYEKYKNRKPFMLRSVGYPLSPSITASRVAVGMQFGWYERIKDQVKLLIATCTSFGEDGTYFTACTYKNEYDYHQHDRELQINDFVDVGRGNHHKVDSIEDMGLTIRLKPKVYRDIYEQRKIDRRFRIDHAAIKEYHKILDQVAEWKEQRSAQYDSIKQAEKAIDETMPNSIAGAYLKALLKTKHQPITTDDDTRAETDAAEVEELT